MRTCFELTENLKSRVAKGGMTQAKLQKTLGLVKGILDYEDCNDVDIVIEVCSHAYSFFNILWISDTSYPWKGLSSHCHSLIFYASYAYQLSSLV